MRDEAEHRGDSAAVGLGARRCGDAEGVTETLWGLLRGATATRVTGVVAELGRADALAGGAPPWFALLGHALFASYERNEAEWRRLVERAGLQLDAVGDRLLQATCP